ncbi:GIY-YIG nuclease family protein [Ekhidna sp.]|uniref:GIY-YIG nuclease family protein n=1 Tax=Ekhidna sp. TaxID=2608089 RepID=UPI0035139EDD
MHYTVYILKCSDDSYYVGVTNDISERVVQHNERLNRRAYTYSRRPVQLVFEEHFHDVNQAIAFEKQVKGWRREKKEALINRDWSKLPDLSIAYRDKIMSSSRASD